MRFLVFLPWGPSPPFGVFFFFFVRMDDDLPLRGGAAGEAPLGPRVTLRLDDASLLSAGAAGEAHLPMPRPFAAGLTWSAHSSLLRLFVLWS